MTSSQPTVGTMVNLVRFILHLNVPCPRCGNDFGYPCRTPAGRYMATVHAERDRLAVSECRSAFSVLLSSRNAARMKACRASSATCRMHQEGNMAAPTITISRTISGPHATIGNVETTHEHPAIT